MGARGWRNCRRGSPALSWSTKKASGRREASSPLRRICTRRCSCRAMAHKMLSLERIEGGNMVLPRTRTSRVPF